MSSLRQNGIRCIHFRRNYGLVPNNVIQILPRYCVVLEPYCKQEEANDYVKPKDATLPNCRKHEPCHNLHCERAVLDWTMMVSTLAHCTERQQSHITRYTDSWKNCQSGESLIHSEVAVRGESIAILWIYQRAAVRDCKEATDGWSSQSSRTQWPPTEREEWPTAGRSKVNWMTMAKCWSKRACLMFCLSMQNV